MNLYRLLAGAGLAVALFSGGCSKDDSGTPQYPKAPYVPVKSKMTLSFASTADQKKLKLGLIAAETVPDSVKVYKVKADGTSESEPAATGKVDKTGNVTLSLDSGVMYTAQGFDSSGNKTEHNDAFTMPKVDNLPAAKKAEARTTRIAKAATKMKMLPTAVARAKVINDAKPVAKRKSDNVVAASVNMKTLTKAAEKVKKQSDKDEKKATKAGTKVDTAAAEKKQTATAKAAAKASEKKDEKKKEVAKKTVAKKKLALGLAEEPTDTEIEDKQEDVDALIADCQSDPKTVAKFNSEDGVDFAKIDDSCRESLAKSYPDDADLINAALAPDDLAAAAKEEASEASADEKPSDEDLKEIQAGGAADFFADVALKSSTWDNLSSAQKASFSASIEIALNNLSDADFAAISTAVQGTEVSATDADKYPLLKIARLFQQSGTAAEVAAAVKLISDAFTGDDASEFTSDQEEEVADEKADDEASSTEYTEDASAGGDTGGDTGGSESSSSSSTSSTSTTGGSSTTGDTGGDE